MWEIGVKEIRRVVGVGVGRSDVEGELTYQRVGRARIKLLDSVELMESMFIYRRYDSK